MSSVRLETPRLLLREWKETDTEPWIAMNMDPDVRQFFQNTLTVAESEHFIKITSQALLENKFGLWAVEVKETQEFIGFIGLAVPSFEAHFTPCTEIGWRLKKSAWGKGYATEGAHEVLRYAFQDLHLNEVVSMTTLSNERSWKVMERIGMHRNPDDDFDHPRIDKTHALNRHILYRIEAF